jgi:hypothetical protein
MLKTDKAIKAVGYDFFAVTIFPISARFGFHLVAP